MTLILFAILILMLAGVAALCGGSSARWSTSVGVGGAVAGSLVGLFPTISVLLGAPGPVLLVPWEVPYGSFSVALDALLAFFLLPIFLLSIAAAVYGSQYLWANRAVTTRRARMRWAEPCGVRCCSSPLGVSSSAWVPRGW